MLSRGDATGLVTGVMVALPSGVATALSTLNKNSSGLVGVAISLSLLPPAVNAGVCWAYSMMLHTDTVDRNSGDDTDYARNGVISFALTVINIFCIWVAGSFTFWMKKVRRGAVGCLSGSPLEKRPWRGSQWLVVLFPGCTDQKDRRVLVKRCQSRASTAK